MRSGVAAVVCLLAAIVVGGYLIGRNALPIDPDTPVVTPSVRDSADEARSRPEAVVLPTKPVALPSPLTDLDGHAFIAALPELERRARSGDAEAMKLVFYHLQECTSYEIPDDTELTRRVDSWYARQPAFVQERSNPGHDSRREEFLQRLVDQRDRCLALTPKQIDSRLDFALMALRQHDRDMFIAFSVGSFRTEGAELVRNAERIIELRDVERREMDRLVEEGDLDAMARAAYGHSGRGSDLLSKDPVRAYALAYARSLADLGNGDSGMKYLMNELAEKSLSPEQVAAAAAEGDALYQRCCAGAK